MHINHHKVPGDTAPQLDIRRVDAPGAGGAHHRYEISGADLSGNPEFNEHRDGNPQAPVPVLFQNGPIKEAGVNGITAEALAAIIIDRLECFQAGPFNCAENAGALHHFKMGLDYLQTRTRARIARGVEGTSEV